MTDKIAEARLKTEEVYDILVKVLATDPHTLPRAASEANLRCAWLAILSLRVSLDEALRRLQAVGAVDERGNVNTAAAHGRENRGRRP